MLMQDFILDSRNLILKIIKFYRIKINIFIKYILSNNEKYKNFLILFENLIYRVFQI